MDRRYSPITDLYGTAPQDEPPRRRSYTVLYVLLVVAGLFVFESIRPVMRLRMDPPPSVVGAKLNNDASHYQSQLRTARACWAFAIDFVQNLYPYGKSLPKSPPPATHSRIGKASALSQLCWPRLRVAWTQRKSWKRSYELSTDWIYNPESSFRRTLHKVMDAFGINL